LGVGKCRLAVCTAENSGHDSVDQLNGCRVATSFPRVAEQFFGGRQINVHLVPLSGSVEIMISLGVADAIVDLVQTGSTLAANHLQVVHEIGRYETVLIQNQRQRNSEVASRVVRRLEGVVIARSYTLLEYNVPRAKLDEAERITPGFNSPTVNSLEDPAWCAVQVMVRRPSVIEVMDQLEAIGATAIIETRIVNCRL